MEQVLCEVRWGQVHLYLLVLRINAWMLCVMSELTWHAPTSRLEPSTWHDSAGIWCGTSGTVSDWERCVHLRAWQVCAWSIVCGLCADAWFSAGDDLKKKKCLMWISLPGHYSLTCNRLLIQDHEDYENNISVPRSHRLCPITTVASNRWRTCCLHS
jgi:hypothetical protein